MSLNSNNNKKGIHKLAKRSLKVNPFRNGCILVAVTICTILMILVPVLNSASFQIDFDIINTQEQASFQKLDSEQIAGLKNNPEFICTVLNKKGSVQRIQDTFVRFAYTEYSEKEIVSYQLIEGNEPEQMYEAVLEEEVAEQLQLSVGDIILFKDLKESFVICGIGNTIAQEDSIPRLYVSKLYAEKGACLKQRPYQMKVKIEQKNGMNRMDVAEKLEKLAKDLNINSEYIDFNILYLYSVHFTADRISFYAFIDLSILLAGILVIYSVFFISVISRIPLFGQLSTIGMSRRQIRRFINEEGLCLSVIGTVLGMIGAGVISYFLVPVYWNLRIFLSASIVVGIITTLIIMLSIQKPASIAANISPIEAVRYDFINGKKNKMLLKTHKITPHSIASIRFRRDRKKIFFTMLSLIVGGILFFVSTSYISSIDIETFTRSGYFKNYEYLVTFEEELYYDEVDLTDMQIQGLFTEDLINELKKVPELESVERSKGTLVSFELQGDIIYEEVSVINKEKFEREVQPYLLDQTLTYEKLVQQNGVIYTRNEDSQAVYGASFHVGDTVVLDYYNKTGKNSQEVVMAGFTQREYLKEYFIYGSVLIPEEIMNIMMPGIDMTKELLIKTVDGIYSEELDQVIYNIIEKHPLLSVTTFYEQIQERNRQIQLIQQILIVISVFGILFSIINMLNTILTAMITRDKELALLEAIGMQEKQIKKMLLYESLYLTLPSIIISIILGGCLGYFLVSLTELGQTTMTFSFSLWVVVIYTISMITIPLGLSYYFYHRFSKKTIMERLKLDE